MAINLNQCNQACFGCIKKYKKKHSLRNGETFDIECRGIPAEYVPPEVLSTFPPEEQASAKALFDPVFWAAETLDWHCLDLDGSIWKRKNPEEYYQFFEKNPGVSIEGRSRYHRPYQAEMLQCLKGDSYVFMADGTVKYIKDVNIGDKVITYNEKKKNTQSSYKVLNKWNNGLKDIFKISLSNGDELFLTENHPILSYSKTGKLNSFVKENAFKREYRSLEQGLSVDDKVYTFNQFSIFGTETRIALAKLLGYIVTDGYINTGKKNVLEFRNIRKEYIDEYQVLLKEIFGTTLKEKYHPQRIDKNGVTHKEHWSCSVYGKKHPVLQFLHSIGCTNKLNKELSILNFAFKFSEEALPHFINRCWSGDGNVYSYKTISSLRLASGNKEYLQLFRLLLKKLRIHASHIYKNTKDLKNKGIVLDIRRVEDQERFFSKCGVIFGKESQSKTVIENLKTRSHYNRTGHLAVLSRTKIVSIEYFGKEEVYDIEVETRHNFVANGIIVHNCTAPQIVSRMGRQIGKTESLIIKILFNLFTKPGRAVGEGFKVIVITPFQAQIDLIFERLNTLIKSSPVTQNSIKRSVKAPVYTLELHNGSLVRGFTAGSKSGGNADSVRGQSAHMLVFDEADYLAEGDLDSALAIVTNHPGATIWMSSTPTGRRERFYETCLSKNWKEFHYPSHINPMFGAQIDRIYKENLSSIGYKHEILAEFGEQEEGVFQNSYVQAAKASYKYGQHSYNHTWQYTVGVDWNDTKNGTTIAVLGLDPARNKFTLVDKYIVSRDGWTQLAASQKIAEVNRLWKPMSIYVDAGFGSTQYEVLRKFGFDAMSDPTKGKMHPDSRIPYILKQYDFGSRIDTRDIFTGLPLKKDAKPFLVESAMRRFEAQDIEFSEFDSDLEKQLLGYVIDRITPTGRPVYKASEDSIGDHFLDALMLSIVAFVLEATPIGKPKISQGVLFTGHFGENLEPPIYEGDTVVRPDTVHQRQKEKTRHKPEGRAIESEQASLFKSKTELPANHVQSGNKPGLWSWDGFLRDDPRPEVRSMSQIESDYRRRNGLSPLRGSKPRRKNI